MKDEGDLDPEDSKDPPPATVRTIVASPPSSVLTIKADIGGIQAPVENVSTSVAASELSGAMSGDSADSFQGPPDEGNHTDT